MGWQPSTLTGSQMEERRLAGATLLRAGYSQAEVARALNVSEKAVSVWASRFRHGGAERLRTRPRTGRPSRLTPKQWRQVLSLLHRDPQAYGYSSERWTLCRIAHLIHEKFGVSFNPNYLSERLHQLRFSPQLPKQRAVERDDELVFAWLTHDWPRIKRGLRGPMPQ
jgi:transposase